MRLGPVIWCVVPVAVALGADTTTAARPAEVTFTKDVAPILQRSCQNCHRPGSIAPMSLLTYKDARPWARSIKEKVVRRQMPPWHIDRTIGITKFKDDPSLTDAEIATISNWVDQGAPEGNPADMPPPRQFSDADKWHIGKPDLVVSMPKPYMLKAKGGDEYYDIDLDPGFKEDMYVSAVETKPDSGFKVVHHATTNLVEDPEEDPVGLFLNEYAVGKNADLFPSQFRPSDPGGLEDPSESPPAPVWRGNAGQHLGRIQVLPQGRGAEVCRVHPAHGRCDRSGYSRRPDYTQRWLLPVAEAGADFGVSAALPHARQGAVHGSHLPGRPAGFGAPWTGPNRDAQLRERLPVWLEHHLPVRRGRGAAAARGHDHPHHHLA